jgi:hypothetical protein
MDDLSLLARRRTADGLGHIIEALVRFGAQLVMLRTRLKAQLKAVLAKHGLRRR